MKKHLFAVMLALIAYVVAPAQTDTLLIHYSSPKYDDPFVKNLVRLQNISQLQVTLSGDSLKGNKFIYRCHRVVDGVSTEIHRCPFQIPVRNACVRILLGAYPLGSDSVKIAFDGPVSTTMVEPVATSGHILMETYPERPVAVGDTIPIMAYTPGIPYRRKFAGEVCDAVDYCGLRDARVHPREWYAKYGIDDFIYYDIIFFP